ncbi:hypothetical protein HY624_00290 [Candidatus Uhrbacteria bacterium]|nr:hypothetical protein [Candidatus Uhrbacteria bacterium]
MTMLIVTLAIFVLTGMTSVLRRFISFPVCPICVGVSSTWIVLLGLLFSGFAIDTRVLAILMGGSIVGIAYKAEPHLVANQSPMLWKSLFIPIGFLLVYGVIDRAWSILGISAAVIAGIALWFFLPRTIHEDQRSTRTKSIEEKMKNCC